jgi:hypothetical protein
MGYTECHKDPNQSVRDFFQEELCGDKIEILDSALVNLHEFYAACRTKSKPEQVWAMVGKIDFLGGEYFNFGYRMDDETVGPVWNNCPERILNMLTSPAGNEWAEQWRQRCRDRINARKQSVKIADNTIIKFESPIYFGLKEQHHVFKKVKWGNQRSVFLPVYELGKPGQYTGNPLRITKWNEKKYEILESNS